MDIEQAAQVFTDPKAYADDARFHAACAVLRREAPVARVDVDGFFPFWAITKHDDVMEIARSPEQWLNGPRPALGPKPRDGESGEVPVRTLVQMDAPEHPVYRQISSAWFKPKSIARLSERTTELAKRYIDEMAGLGGECDFVTDVALHFPLHVILSLLGLPEADYPRLLKLTQDLFGNADPELGRGEAASEDLVATLLEFFEYFQHLIEDRRAHPRDDLASVIANAEVDGAPIGIMEAVGYYVLIATAGHDTTSSAIAGGLEALTENPRELQRLRDDPGLVPSAVEEMIRWVSPVKQFMRTATEDYELRGVTIRAGESVLLSYPSANRDEEIFERPDTFDVTRDPNRHVGFGFGAHYCLGTHLARMEARALYAELVPRLASVELAGAPSHMETLFVGGLKHLPIRYELA